MIIFVNQSQITVKILYTNQAKIITMLSDKLGSYVHCLMSMPHVLFAHY